MKNISICILMIGLLILGGCNTREKYQYLPEEKNDHIFTVIGGDDSKKENLHQGDGYSIRIPAKGYRYEKEIEDGFLEESWEYTKKDDIEFQIITYHDMDVVAAKKHFLNEKREYRIEDEMGSPVLGTDFDGDVMWFQIKETTDNIYIISWEYSKNTKESIQKELSDIAESFMITD